MKKWLIASAMTLVLGLGRARCGLPRAAPSGRHMNMDMVTNPVLTHAIARACHANNRKADEPAGSASTMQGSPSHGSRKILELERAPPQNGQ